MAEFFSNIIQSDLFTFKVGSGEVKDEIKVHSKAIAATCEYMKNLVEGDMKEAQERCAEQDMETEDFVRFVEFAYRGDYTTPSWILEETLIPDEPEVEVCEAPPPEPEPPEEIIEDVPAEAAPEPVPEQYVVADDGWGWQPAKKKKAKDKAKVFRTDNFNSRNYLEDGDPKQAILQGFDPQGNTAPNQDFTPVFLAYARLYGFAEMRLIHQLKALTLHKLYHTLQNFTLFPARFGDVIELVRCVYENTPGRKADGTIDALRKLVVDYVACEHQDIGKSKEFREVMEDGGEFVSDFWDVVSRHLI